MDDAESGVGERDRVSRIGEVDAESACYWRRGPRLTSIFMLRMRSRLYSTWSHASWRYDSAKRCGLKTIVGWYWQSDEWLGCLARDVGRASDTAAIFGRENQWVFARGKEKPFVLVWCSGEFCRNKKGGRPFCVERFLFCPFFKGENKV
jgi:hypothetical protein